jgi:hypothetical protein
MLLQLLKLQQTTRTTPSAQPAVTNQTTHCNSIKRAW